MRFEHEIKCVVWDLDDTLWDGTLAEADDVQPRAWVAELIAQLDASGIVNSICSKNNADDAKRLLSELGILDYFVFPVIDFIPKGQVVKSIIENMQLRAANVLFVDDNVANRQEVQHYCEDIMVADANDPEFLPAIRNVIQNTRGSSRLERYRILEAKHGERRQYADNTDFLKSSGITICIVRNPEDLVFKDRIRELANRTNQLNFTNSRFTEAEIEDYFSGTESIHRNHGVVFVYDNFGDYGLVGFYAIDEANDYGSRQLEHYLFSCRIMNMGVEQAVYRYMREAFGIEPFQPLEERLDQETAFINILTRPDRRVREYIETGMDSPDAYPTAIIARCTSGVIEHYLPPEMRPARFDTFGMLDDVELGEVEQIIYTVYSEYIDLSWNDMGLKFSIPEFQRRLEKFCQRNSEPSILLLLASERNYPTRDSVPPGLKGWIYKRSWWLRDWYRGRGIARIKQCNAVVRSVAERFPNVHTVELTALVQNEAEQINLMHFERIVFKRAAEQIVKMVARVSQASA